MEQDCAWVEQLTGGSVTRFEQTTAGRSRATWLVDVDRPGEAPLALVLRRDTGDGPLSGSELSLQRESVVYAALAATDVPVPRLLGVAPDGAALLVERVQGTEDLGGPGEARQRALDSFVSALATLHNVDTAGLDLPGFGRPATPADHALVDLALWRRVFDAEMEAPAPLLRFAFRWLAEHAPEGVDRTVLCHGDLGPGNFLHLDGEVTALLDWEFAHLGDPMDDLAWLSIRAAQVCGIDDITDLLARYTELTGIKVDAARVRYFQAVVLLRMAVACHAGLRRRSGGMDVTTYLALLPLLERQLTNVLAGLLGVELEPTPRPEPTAPTRRAVALEVVVADLGSKLMPELQSAAARSRALGMTALLMHLQAADTLGPAVDAADLADLVSALGAPAASIDEARRSLEAVVDGAAPERWPELLQLFSRAADRQLALWPIVAPMAARPLARVEAP